MCIRDSILAANGMYGKEISQMIKTDIIIADIQMPQLNGIDMIKYMIANGVKSKIFINSAAVDNDNEDIIELVKNTQITFVEKGNFDWINLV
jgi:response regulator of citrate/malate metabolism